MYCCLCCVVCDTSSNVMTEGPAVQCSSHLTKLRVSAEMKRIGNNGIEDSREGRKSFNSLLAHLHILALNSLRNPPHTLHCIALQCVFHAQHFCWSILASCNITQCHVMSCYIHMLPTLNRLINHIIATV